MAIYDAFAEIYHDGPYTSFSRNTADLILPLLERFDFYPRDLLDVACGEGTFAIAMASRPGLAVTGADQSERMLEIAQRQAVSAGVSVSWVQRDMRALQFEGSFDLVTCWFDSLNYLLEEHDLLAAFQGMARALRPLGLLVFDMNTIYGLGVEWQRQGCYVQQDTSNVFEIHRSSFDYEHLVATVKISAFIRHGKSWRRIDEEHRERAYPIEQLKAFLIQAGLQPLACYGSLRELSEPQPSTRRIWMVARKF